MQLRLHPTVQAEVDEDYRGLANEFPHQITAPPRKPKDLDNTPLTERYGWRVMRRRQYAQASTLQHQSRGTPLEADGGLWCSDFPRIDVEPDAE